MGLIAVPHRPMVSLGAHANSGSALVPPPRRPVMRAPMLPARSQLMSTVRPYLSSAFLDTHSRRGSPAVPLQQIAAVCNTSPSIAQPQGAGHARHGDHHGVRNEAGTRTFFRGKNLATNVESAGAGISAYSIGSRCEIRDAAFDRDEMAYASALLRRSSAATSRRGTASSPGSESRRADRPA